MKFILYPIVILLLLVSCDTKKEVESIISNPNDSLFIVSNYTKSEVYIEMRDGVKLFTSIYTPINEDQEYPILLVRTPYSVSPYGTDNSNYRTSLGPSSLFTQSKYIFVYQDVRGAYMSEGIFDNMRPHLAGKKSDSDTDESTDTYDTIDWLIKNAKNNNGKVGQWGISYPGFYTSAGMIDSHPALVAASPQAPIADWWYDDFHHHGAFFLPHTFNFFASFGKPRPSPTTSRNPRFKHGTDDGYSFFLDLGSLKNAKLKYFGDSIAFWDSIASHPNYDYFWQSRNILPHLKNINCAVLTVGGWYDAEDLYGPLATYRTIENENAGIFNAMVMGPWSHGGWARTEGEYLGDVHFGNKTALFYNEKIIFPFFEHHLKNAKNHDLPEAYVFETGTNQWRKFAEWPPKNTINTKLYMRQKKQLTTDAPRMNEFGLDEFVSDPNKPVPYTNSLTTGMIKEYMTEDQSFVLSRADTWYYQTEPITEAMTIAGPFTARLNVSTNATDADWIVKLIDVYPNTHPPYPHQEKSMANYHQMVRSEVIRGRFRKNASLPEPFVPNESEEVTLILQDVLHTFKPGHKLMVQIQSTWFPLVDRNPQKYVDNIFEADESDFTKANHKIWRSGVAPSLIEFGVLSSKKE